MSKSLIETAWGVIESAEPGEQKPILPCDGKFGLSHKMPDDKRSGEWAKQREQYGFDVTTCWNLDSAIIKFALPRLTMYRNLVFGYPAGVESFEEWLRILDEMIEGFAYIVEKENAYDPKAKRAIELFSEYWTTLWI